MKVKSKVWLQKKGKLVFGEGKSELLKAIQQTGSINKATGKMGISFRHAWGYIAAIEKRLGFKLLERRKGGKNGGGSHLTPAARKLIKRFDKLSEAVNKCADNKFEEIFGDQGRISKD